MGGAGVGGANKEGELPSYIDMGGWEEEEGGIPLCGRCGGEDGSRSWSLWEGAKEKREELGEDVGESRAGDEGWLSCWLVCFLRFVSKF